MNLKGLAPFATFLLVTSCGRDLPLDIEGPISGWPMYGGNELANRHSNLNQITSENVHQLEIAWVYHSGDVDDGSNGIIPTAFQATPIILGDSLYFCTPFNRVISVYAETGKQRWTYDPDVDQKSLSLRSCRGVSSWTSKEVNDNGHCSSRIFSGTLDGRIVSLDAETGAPCKEFGDDGTFDLTEGLGRVNVGEYGVSSPPLIANDTLITGSWVADNRGVDMPGGVVRAYDVKSGELIWAWDPVPADAPAPPESVQYRRGTANAWSVFSADEELGLVYIPTGNTSPDFYGGHRGGWDKYASSIVALKIETGEVAWSFQTVHHDVWDYDVGSQPVLFDYVKDNTAIPAVIQATKTGHVFFLDRRNGEPIFDVVEKKVPQGGIFGEHLSPTQPFPKAPPQLHNARLNPDDVWAPTPWHKAQCLEQIGELRNEGLFTPPSLQGSVMYPGFFGGANWGSLSQDPGRNLLVVNTMQMAASVKLVPREELESIYPDGLPEYGHSGFQPQFGTPYAAVSSPLMTTLGTPCSPPPWGKLWGIDTTSGEIVWSKPFGTARDVAPFPVWMFLADGVPNIGGPISTSTGLTFIGATTDKYLRAIETETGKELWRGRLPWAAQSTPITYRLTKDSRQFVVVAAGGHGVFSEDVGDALVAFALP